MFYYFNMFFIGSVLGFFMELGMKMFFPSMNSSILYGPWIPVYGFGVVFAIMIERFVFNRIKVNRIFKIFLMFILIAISCTIVEFIGGHLIEFLFDKTFWNYSDLKFNFGKYVSLEISLLWGLISLCFIYFIKPIIEKFINKIPRWFSILAFVAIIIDCIFTLMKA